MPHLHIIGICGTAMAGVAALAREQGWHVTGSDHGVYPPMSTFLANLGIATTEGFAAANLTPTPDLVLVGNAISRGNPELEALLDRGLPFRSGAEWLFEHVLEGRHPVVVTGTHGKTTTTSMIAKIMDAAGWQPGFFIGGIPQDFGHGARLPVGPWVVVEGDEYDTAFFDKQPKFLHYRPRTLVLHNLEYDHADIYPDLESIRRQFRILLRLVPAAGHVVAHMDDPEIQALCAQAFGPVTSYGLSGDHTFSARLVTADGCSWQLLHKGRELFQVNWNLLGHHNVLNGLAAAAAVMVHGMPPAQVKAGLEGFQGVARRLQLRYRVNDISVYDDFAHHPTAIATTLAGLRAAVGSARIWAVLEPRSNTMRRRIHQDRLAPALRHADRVILARPATRGLADADVLDVDRIVEICNADRQETEGKSAIVVGSAVEAVQFLASRLKPSDHVLVMSNGGFDGIHEQLRKVIAHA